MPVVFIHGVNVRKGPGYEAGRLVTHKFLQKHLQGATIHGKVLHTVEPVFPYWGDLATKFAWDMASLPSGEIDSLGTPGVENELRPLVAQIKDALKDPAGAQNEPLTALAKQSLPLALDIISRLLIQSSTDADAEKTSSFVVAAQAYAEANPHPVWMNAIQTDAQLVNRLVQEVKGEQPPGTPKEALGVFDSIVNQLAAASAKLKNAVKTAVGTVLDRTGDFASTKLLGWTREPMNAILGRFFGDVFVYFDTRGDKNYPGDIPSLILKAIDAAVATGPAGEPLVVVGHSLGGVITYDLISHFRPDLEVDLFRV